MVSEWSKAQELSVSALTGVLGAPIAAWVFWTLFHGPTCEPQLLTGSRDCVVTVSGESRSWPELAATPAAVIFGFVLAVVAYIVLDILTTASKGSEQPL